MAGRKDRDKRFMQANRNGYIKGKIDFTLFKLKHALNNIYEKYN